MQLSVFTWLYFVVLTLLLVVVAPQYYDVISIALRSRGIAPVYKENMSHAITCEIACDLW